MQMLVFRIIFMNENLYVLATSRTTVSCKHNGLRPRYDAPIFHLRSYRRNAVRKVTNKT